LCHEPAKSGNNLSENGQAGLAFPRPFHVARPLAALVVEA
jgi:hypothetical protein